MNQTHKYSKLKKADTEWAHKNLTAYKKQNFLVDFEDMLYKALPDNVKFEITKWLWWMKFKT